MHIGHCERILQHCSVLVGHKPEEMIETALPDVLGQLVKPLPATYEQEQDIGVISEALGCG